MKQTFTRILWTIAGLMLVIPRAAFADDHVAGGSGTGKSSKIINPVQANTIAELINFILSLVLQVSVPIAVIFLIYSGFLFVTARGDTAQLEKARSTFLWTVVGTAVLLGASALAGVIQGTIDQIKS